MGNSQQPQKDYAPFFKDIRSGTVTDVLRHFSSAAPPKNFFTLNEKDYISSAIDGNTPLHVSTYNSDSEVISLCISLDFPFIPNSRGDTPLHLVAKRGDIDKIRLIVSSLSSMTSTSPRSTTLSDLKRHANNKGKRPYDLVPSGSDECKRLLFYTPEDVPPGFQNNILEGLCRVGVIRDSIKIGLVTPDDSYEYLIFAFSKGRVHRVFTLMISDSRQVTLNGPVASLKGIVAVDESSQVTSNSIRECCVVENMSMYNIFCIAKTYHSLLGDGSCETFASVVYSVLFLLKGKADSTLLTELLEVLDTSLNERFVPSIVGGHLPHLPHLSYVSQPASSIPTSSSSHPVETRCEVRNVRVVDKIKRIRSTTLSSVDSKRSGV